ncbi:prephenate dehydrogenase [Oceanobacillus saliphilus]|uniref:prephenate dehydrogenase n=1 Tax=Oceanobacillus saliphilus TaxID=2925834 RepID=UPI00201E4B3E|nr:prephenate dehydrogenase [Oceanobacillus saliphilus]
MNKTTILVAGMGLIGGSLAKGMAASEENYIIGYDPSHESLKFALLNGIIHESSTNFAESATNADFIILAAPISDTISLMKELNTINFNKNVIVTDTASVKSPIIETATHFNNEQITFIGGHPMAGSHKKGVQAAKAHLFENAIYVLSPMKECSETDVAALQHVLKNTKSKFVVLQPDEHDEMTGVVSHFPHLIASSLVHQAKKWEITHAFLPNLAAGGFRDITRIASSNPKMWQDIFHHNRNKMSTLLEEWIEEMKYLKVLLEKDEKDKMISYLDKAKLYRDGLAETEKGAIPSFYDLYVDIRDQPGALASVVQLLANEDVSIKNIEILEVREDITGVLRLSFYTKEAQIKSSELLENNGYETMIQH